MCPKIVVYNSRMQSGLSRRQIEIIFDVLPDQYAARIQEIHLSIDRDSRNIEPFEYSQQNGTVLFAFPVIEKSPESTRAALEAFLVGLARIQAGSRFFAKLRDLERQAYSAFVEAWRTKVMDEFQR